MPDNRLYSIAAVARQLDVPESTLHYWKNRFRDHLPCLGEGRGRRFRPEALEIFRAIAQGLGRGLSVDEVKVDLADRFPVNVSPARSPAGARTGPVAAAASGIGLEEVAAVFGREMAKVLSAFLRERPNPEAALPGGPGPEVAGEIEALREKNQALESKLGVLESELMRLRKDGRELEKYLVDKIKAAFSAKA
ncbi:helix-turn-helix domain-containing protein [Desulfolutivibrio sp.]|uniref:helix-turn-helix domain-containing protein n=1 Tax=Desulfolutivibrio sp. TaxID=2773296 RepID=UPI002F960F20